MTNVVTMSWRLSLAGHIPRLIPVHACVNQPGMLDKFNKIHDFAWQPLIIGYISMAKYKAEVSPQLTYWRYRSLPLSSVSTVYCHKYHLASHHTQTDRCSQNKRAISMRMNISKNIINFAIHDFLIHFPQNQDPWWWQHCTSQAFLKWKHCPGEPCQWQINILI